MAAEIYIGSLGIFKVSFSGGELEKNDKPAASTASRTASLLCVEQLSTIMMLFGSGNGFIKGSYIHHVQVSEGCEVVVEERLSSDSELTTSLTTKS
jgi:hypothetical protein